MDLVAPPSGFQKPLAGFAAPSGATGSTQNALSPPLRSYPELTADAASIGSAPLRTCGQLALGKMEENESEMWILEGSIDAVARAVRVGEMPSYVARDELAQLEGKLIRLQCQGIDKVALSLQSGSASAEEAQDLKMQLTMKAEDLQNRMERIFAKLQGGIEMTTGGDYGEC